MKIFYSTTFLTWVACLLIFSFTVKAQIQSYPAGGDWDDPLTWIGNIVPGPIDDVIIDGNVTISNFVACNNITLTSTGIVNDPPILQGLQFLAMMGNESFEWFLNETSLIGHPDFLGGGTPTLSFLFPSTSTHYGIYNCI
ncbi:MAG: hypothetical protein K8R86_08675 [Bacteroidales bacterium]|nr:hypothetical protein [Bacteroidales bacterium]